MSKSNTGDKNLSVCATSKMFYSMIIRIIEEENDSFNIPKRVSIYQGDIVAEEGRPIDSMGGFASRAAFSYLESKYFDELINATDNKCTKLVANLLAAPENAKLIPLLKSNNYEYITIVTNKLNRLFTSKFDPFEKLVTKYDSNIAKEHIINLIHAFTIMQFKLFYVYEKPYSQSPVVYYAFHQLYMCGYFEGTDDLLASVFARINGFYDDKKKTVRKTKDTKAKTTDTKKTNVKVENQETAKNVNKFDLVDKETDPFNAEEADPFAADEQAQ